MQFEYEAINTNGKREKSILEANQEKEIIEYLRSKQLIPIKIKRKNDIKITDRLFFKKVSNEDIVFFTRQLSSMTQSGLTILEALKILKKQTNKENFASVIDDLIANISEGRSFSQALAQHPQVFTPVYIALIKAAESGGIVSKILMRLAENLERTQNIKKDIRAAMFYPAIILVGVGAVVIVMNVFVIPQLGELYSNLDLALPLTTRIVLAISDFFTRFYLLLIPLTIFVVYAYKRIQKTPSGKRKIDEFKLKIPLIGDILKLQILSDTTRTFSLMISSGTSIIEALNITANVAGNKVYKESLDNTAVLVEKGISLSNALESEKIFPPIVVQMAKVGESTGKIDESLAKVSEYFERDLNLKIKSLTSSIEPILIITMGVIVAFIILSVITPIYSLITQLQ